MSAQPTRVVVHAVDTLLVPLQRHVGGGVAQAPHLRGRQAGQGRSAGSTAVVRSGQVSRQHKRRSGCLRDAASSPPI